MTYTPEQKAKIALAMTWRLIFDNTTPLAEILKAVVDELKKQGEL